MRALIDWLRPGRGKHRYRRTSHPPPPVTAEETAAARAESELALEAARAQGPEVQRIARGLRSQRELNHFGLMITRALKEGR